MENKLKIEDNLIKSSDNVNGLELARKAGKIHSKIRTEVSDYVKPNMPLINICKFIENRINHYTNNDENNPLSRGIAFPVGLSVNNCAAHWTPNPGDNHLLKYDDVLKIDFGIHYNGYIIDAAFTKTFNPVYDNLVNASIEATNVGIKNSGPDAILGEIGSEIQETIESYEIELNGKTKQLKSIKNLSGHRIGKYKIHYNKFVPNIKTNYTERMKSGEYYAIETFPSTGSDITINGTNTSHYMINYTNPSLLKPRNKKDLNLYNIINQNYNTLAFCRRWLKEKNINKYQINLKNLVNSDIVKEYPPLYCSNDSYVAQTEHTIVIKDNGKEILSK